MKFQLLLICICFVVFATFMSSTSNSVLARPIEERGIAGKIVKTVKKLLFKGVGTFFDPVKEGGSQGACGPYADVHSQIVAMNAAQYGDMSKKSHWCGKKLKICSNKKCTVATVTDACPGCKKGCLDLTPAVWGQLESDYKKGVIPIEWHEYRDDSDDSDEEDERT